MPPLGEGDGDGDDSGTGAAPAAAEPVAVEPAAVEPAAVEPAANAGSATEAEMTDASSDEEGAEGSSNLFKDASDHLKGLLASGELQPGDIEASIQKLVDDINSDVNARIEVLDSVAEDIRLGKAAKGPPPKKK